MIKSLTNAGYDAEAGEMSQKFGRFKNARLLHPKRQVEQPISTIQKIMDEISGYTTIKEEVIICGWNRKCVVFKWPDCDPLFAFDKTRCWSLLIEREKGIVPSDACNHQFASMTSESKVKGFLR